MDYPKFIIEDGNIIVSKCKYHKQLASNPVNVSGGGWFRFKNGNMTFYGASTEFGPAKLDDIKKAVLANKVYSNPSCSKSISDKYHFYYDTGSFIIDLEEKGNS